MSEAPSMPMFWDAYIADTTHLSTEEHGAYLLLLAAMWRRGGFVPDDDKDTARILGLTKAKWLKIKARLLLPPINLIVADGEVSQKKLQKTWKKTQEKIEKNRANGAKGGRPKSNENKDIAKANGSVSVNPNESIPEPEPEPIKEDTNVSLSVSTDAPPHANDVSEAVTAYNAAADRTGWPKVQKLTPTRSKQIRARLSDCGGIDGWGVAVGLAENSDFLCGRTAKPWTGFGFDWLIKSQNFTKLMEGNYANRNAPNSTNGHSGSGSGGRGSGTVDAFAAVAARMSAGQN